MSIAGFVSGSQTSVQNTGLGPHFKLFRSILPIFLDSAQNVVRSLEDSGQFQELVGQTVDALSEKSYGAYVMPWGGRDVAKGFILTPQLMCETLENLKSKMDEAFLQAFLEKFKSNLPKNISLESGLARLMNACVAWLSRDVSKNKQSLPDFLSNDPELLTLLNVLCSAFADVIVDVKKQKQVSALLNVVMPAGGTKQAIGFYFDYIVQTEVLENFLKVNLPKFFKAMLSPQIKSGGTSKIKPEKRVEVKHAEFQENLVQTVLVFKPIIVEAVKAAITPDKVSKLGENILNGVSDNKKLNLVMSKLFSKAKLDELIDKFAFALNGDFLKRILEKASPESLNRIAGLAQEFFGVTAAGTFGAAYNGGTINKIESQELLRKILQELRSLK